MVQKKKTVKRQSQGAMGRSKIGVTIDTELWRRLRAIAIRQGKLTSVLLDAAIKEYLDSHEK